MITGQAVGPETTARIAADACGLGLEIYNAKPGTFKRNSIMLNACDMAIAFWDGQSKGTGHFVDMAVGKGKLLGVIEPEAFLFGGTNVLPVSVEHGEEILRMIARDLVPA